VKAIFEGCGQVASVRSDVGDTWFVTMNSESEAVSTLLALRSKTFNGAAIKARLKSENVLKSFYPTQPAENVIAPGVATPYGGRGYYASPNMGYYDNYGVQYNTVNPRAGQQHHSYNNGENGRYAGSNQRGGAAAGRGQGRQNRANGAGAHQKDGRAKSGSFEQRGAAGSRKGKNKGAKADKQQANGSNNGKKAAAAAPAERQPVLNAANFPPLPNVQETGDKSTVITYKYAHEDIMEIVKNMDEKDCLLPEGKMDYAVHPAALTAEAHPDLLRNQRTYSIEQARDAMRQGRPIRSDSVGSIDYESMMYGEDYTKEAREQRKHKAETAPASAEATPAAKPAAAAASAPVKAAAVPAKVVGYAAAVINGTPAPEPKKKQPAAKAAAKPAAKEEKKPAAAKKAAVKTAESAPKTAAAPAVDETLPKTGAWGGRNFIDVVKADPPAAPVKAAPASESESK
jgi:hypothetical protein